MTITIPCSFPVESELTDKQRKDLAAWADKIVQNWDMKVATEIVNEHRQKWEQTSG